MENFFQSSLGKKVGKGGGKFLLVSVAFPSVYSRNVKKLVDFDFVLFSPHNRYPRCGLQASPTQRLLLPLRASMDSLRSIQLLFKTSRQGILSFLVNSEHLERDLARLLKGWFYQLFVRWTVIGDNNGGR